MPTRHTKPLPSIKHYAGRQVRFLAYAGLMLAISLLIGMTGYAYFGELGAVDAFLNASMILTGMGPIDPMKTDAAKIFAGSYALFSGIAFLSTVAVLLAPVVHRFLHWIHLDMNEDE